MRNGVLPMAGKHAVTLGRHRDAEGTNRSFRLWLSSHVAMRRLDSQTEIISVIRQRQALQQLAEVFKGEPSVNDDIRAFG